MAQKEDGSGGGRVRFGVARTALPIQTRRWEFRFRLPVIVFLGILWFLGRSTTKSRKIKLYHANDRLIHAVMMNYHLYLDRAVLVSTVEKSDLAFFE